MGNSVNSLWPWVVAERAHWKMLGETWIFNAPFVQLSQLTYVLRGIIAYFQHAKDERIPLTSLSMAHIIVLDAHHNHIFALPSGL
jgi:hypothetical protein